MQVADQNTVDMSWTTCYLTCTQLMYSECLIGIHVEHVIERNFIFREWDVSVCA